MRQLSTRSVEHGGWRARPHHAGPIVLGLTMLLLVAGCSFKSAGAPSDAEGDAYVPDAPVIVDAPPDIAGMVGQYAHGNEPGHHVAYLYSYAGESYKTQARVRSLLESMYHNAPDGLAGNEDCGQMSAWYILSALGFYPVDPVSGNYVFGSPLFDSASIELGRGKQLEIETVGNGPDKPYIQDVTWNGKPYAKSWFSHSDIAQGGKFILKMGDKPNAAFGAQPSVRPTSMTLSSNSASRSVPG